MDTKAVGQLGEDMACEYLVEKGFKIVGRNYRISFGEIDIIAKKHWKLFRDNKTIHFVEVKTLAHTSKDFFPEDRVGFEKQQKLKRLAETWMVSHKMSQNHPYQIDVISITFSGESKPKITYFENIVAQ